MAEIYRRMFCEGPEWPMQISGILGSSGGDFKWTKYLGEFRIHRGFKSGCKNSRAPAYSEADCKTWEGVEAEWHYLYCEDVVLLWLYPSVMTHAHYQ
jgi:hypothetical protein